MGKTRHISKSFGPIYVRDSFKKLSLGLKSLFTIEKNNNSHTVQTESSKFASLSFDQGFQIVIPPRIKWQMYQNRLERHLTVFCIDPIVVYFVNLQLKIAILFLDLVLR